ncbi:MAG TPA: hypothetical protein VI072_30895 [Polyangiaceae bacterium]
MSDLDPDARGLIEQVGDRDGPSRADRERVRRLVSASLAAASTAATTASLAAGAAGSVGASLAKSAGVAQIALWVCVGSAVGAAVSAPVLLSDSGPSRPAVIAKPAPTAQRPAQPGSAAVAPALPDPEEAADAGVEPAPVVAQQPLTTKRVPTPAEPASTAAFPAPAPEALEGGLRAETRLLEQAQRARAHGKADEALAILNTYGTRFPGGVLRSESLVMQVLCLCELGRQPEAQALAEQLVRLHPESPLVPRLSRSCVRLPSR